MLEETEAETELDRVHAARGTLLRLRAQADGRAIPTVGIEIAREAFRRLDGMEFAKVDEQVPVFRGLALSCRIDEVLSRVSRLIPRCRGDTYALHLLRGDLHLCAARSAMGMDPVDDEWFDSPPLPTPPFLARAAATAALAAAVAAYREADPIAESEDERLETTWYRQTITDRQERTETLRSLLTETP